MSTMLYANEVAWSIRAFSRIEPRDKKSKDHGIVSEWQDRSG